MRRAVALALVVAALVLGSASALAHTNTVDVDTQVSDNGTVAIERAYALADGYLVVHRTAPDGGPGEPIGHVPISRADGVRFGVPVPVDDAAWAEWGDSRPVWVALHREETGDGFDPDDDPIQQGFGGPVSERVVLGKGNDSVRVFADRFVTQTLDTDAATVREVRLDRDGAVVLRPETANGTGPVVGVRRLAAGTHENVTVPVDDAVFARRGRTLTLVAQLYVGTTDSALGTPRTVGEAAVATSFDVERTGPLNVSNGTTPAGTTGTATTTEALVVTATATADPGATPSPTPAPTTAPTPTPTPAGTGTATGGTATGAGPGFGAVAALAAVALAALALAAGRSRGRSG